jgi:hypothetical protein
MSPLAAAVRSGFMRSPPFRMNIHPRHYCRSWPVQKKHLKSKL